MAWSQAALRDDYGLLTQLPGYKEDPSIPLATEVLELKDWCTTPLHLGRGHVYPHAVKGVTFDNMMETVHGFIGCLFKHASKPSTNLSLHLFSSAPNLALFVSFLQARGVVAPTISTHITHARKVVAFLKWKASSQAEADRLDKLTRWVVLKDQCCICMLLTMHLRCINDASPLHHDYGTKAL